MHEQNRLWDYEVLKELGKGEYGQVYKIQSKKDQRIYALKKINLSSAQVTPPSKLGKIKNTSISRNQGIKTYSSPRYHRIFRFVSLNG